MTQSTYCIRLSVPQKIKIGTNLFNRESFCVWLWEEFSLLGLAGIHEGTVLTDDTEYGNLDAWTIDAAEAPRERDWISEQKVSIVELYFSSQDGAEQAHQKLISLSGLNVETIQKQVSQDWDAVWKASFKGVHVPPFWHVIPPGIQSEVLEQEKIIYINPGAGFGTGTHETTQLCLAAISEISSLVNERVLDFGSGSGILAVASALLGAEVDAVEIDLLALDNAYENAKLNGVESKIGFTKTLQAAGGPYKLIVANILRPILIQFGSQLVERLDLGGAIILSGLVEKDLAELIPLYNQLLSSAWKTNCQPQVRSLGEWRALIWKS